MYLSVRLRALDGLRSHAPLTAHRRKVGLSSERALNQRTPGDPAFGERGAGLADDVGAVAGDVFLRAVWERTMTASPGVYDHWWVWDVCP